MTFTAVFTLLVTMSHTVRSRSGASFWAAISARSTMLAHKVVLRLAEPHRRELLLRTSSSCAAASFGAAAPSIANVWPCSVPKVRVNSRQSGANSS